MKHKIFSFFMTLTLVLAITTPFYANGNNNSYIDNYLLSHGFTQSAIDIMLDEDKEFYYNEGCTAIEITEFNYDENMDIISAKDLMESANCPQKFGQITSTTLSLVWYITKNSSGNICVEYTYVWNNVPISRYQDPIGISWDSSYLKLKDDSFSKADYYIFVDNGGTKRSVLYSEEKGYASVNANGVIWYAKLYPGKCISLRGRGRATLIPKKSSGSTTLFGNYVHKKFTGSLSMSIPGFGNFSISGISSYDERGNQKTFNI